MGGADFVVVTFGLVATPLEEDAQQVADELTRKGYGAEVLEKAHEVTDATGAIVASHFTSGFEELANVKRRFGGEAWFNELRGEYSGDMLRETDKALRTGGRAKYDDLDIEWHYDSRAVLEALTIPELWVLAGDDTEAPSSTTMERLKTLQAEGKPIDLALFPHADHGITEFAVLSDGTRKTTRYAGDSSPLRLILAQPSPGKLRLHSGAAQSAQHELFHLKDAGLGETRRAARRGKFNA
jgi:hypothetical protein